MKPDDDMQQYVFEILFCTKYFDNDQWFIIIVIDGSIIFLKVVWGR